MKHKTNRRLAQTTLSMRYDSQGQQINMQRVLGCVDKAVWAAG